MRRIGWYGGALALVLAVAAPSATHAQTAAACRPLEEMSAEVRLSLQELVTDTTAWATAARARRGIPVVDTAEVQVVTAGPACDRARAAYLADRHPDGGGPDRVHLVRVGPRWVVWAPPMEANWHYIGVLVLSERFEIVGRYLL